MKLFSTFGFYWWNRAKFKIFPALFLMHANHMSLKVTFEKVIHEHNWTALQETLYLRSMSGMRESMATPLEE